MGGRREGAGGEMLHLSLPGVKAQVAYYLDLVGGERIQLPHHRRSNLPHQAHKVRTQSEEKTSASLKTCRGRSHLTQYSI